MIIKKLIIIKNKTKKLLSEKRGFTMVELLAATVIFLLSSAVLVTGMASAEKHFNRELQSSESSILFSTLKDTIDYELSHTSRITYNNKSGDKYTVDTFFSRSFAVSNADSGFCMLDTSGKVSTSGRGYIALGEEKSGNFNGNKIVSDSLYTYGVTAAVSDFYYVNHTDVPSYFTYKLTIYDDDGDELRTDTIDVVPFGSITLEPS